MLITIMCDSASFQWLYNISQSSNMESLGGNSTEVQRFPRIHENQQKAARIFGSIAATTNMWFTEEPAHTCMSYCDNLELNILGVTGHNKLKSYKNKV